MAALSSLMNASGPVQWTMIPNKPIEKVQPLLLKIPAVLLMTMMGGVRVIMILIIPQALQ